MKFPKSFLSIALLASLAGSLPLQGYLASYAKVRIDNDTTDGIDLLLLGDIHDDDEEKDKQDSKILQDMVKNTWSNDKTLVLFEMNKRKFNSNKFNNNPIEKLARLAHENNKNYENVILKPADLRSLTTATLSHILYKEEPHYGMYSKLIPMAKININENVNNNAKNILKKLETFKKNKKTENLTNPQFNILEKYCEDIKIIMKTLKKNNEIDKLNDKDTKNLRQGLASLLADTSFLVDILKAVENEKYKRVVLVAGAAHTIAIKKQLDMWFGENATTLVDKDLESEKSSSPWLETFRNQTESEYHLS